MSENGKGGGCTLRIACAKRMRIFTWKALKELKK